MNQQSRRQAALLDDRLPDCREGRVGPGRHRQVVVADDRQVIRDLESGRLRGAPARPGAAFAYGCAMAAAGPFLPSYPLTLCTQALIAAYADNIAAAAAKASEAIKDPLGDYYASAEYRGQLAIMAGPCAVERLELTVGIAHEVKAAGASILRGGAYKPRTSPYSFQGLGREGLDYLIEAKKQTGLPVVSEILDTRDIELFLEKADIIQIGARNMQNFELLKEVGAYDKPVLLKRGLSATIKEFLLSAEYIMSRGNRNVMLCERGIRTFETQYRNTLDLAAIPTLKELSHLPVIVDPSHATGRWNLVAPMSKAAVAAGADGILIEVHSNPECALCDGEESIKPSKFKELMQDMRKIAVAVGREV